MHLEVYKYEREIGRQSTQNFKSWKGRLVGLFFFFNHSFCFVSLFHFHTAGRKSCKTNGKNISKTNAAVPRGPHFRACDPSGSLCSLSYNCKHVTLQSASFLPASTNCTLIKWQNVNRLVTKWAPAAIVRGRWCWRKGKQPNEVSCQKSTVQRVIWENMTTSQRQGVITASR